jgi:hypothetical protein
MDARSAVLVISQRDNIETPINQACRFGIANIRTFQACLESDGVFLYPAGLWAIIKPPACSNLQNPPLVPLVLVLANS